MITQAGINALSDFRRAKLLENLKQIDPSITDVQAEFVHFIDTVGELSAIDSSKLQKL